MALATQAKMVALSGHFNPHVEFDIEITTHGKTETHGINAYPDFFWENRPGGYCEIEQDDDKRASEDLASAIKHICLYDEQNTLGITKVEHFGEDGIYIHFLNQVCAAVIVVSQ